MAGLSNFIANTATQSTSMPTWYDQAQQNVVNQATTGAGNVPSLGNTVAGGAINQLSNPATNPFTQAQGTLGQIATGAANPWITDATTGAVTPNTNTAMGGLFQAQNQQLNQLLPQYTAPVEGANIASGNFGSLRGQTAVDKAKADAFAQLLPAQMQAALQNQQTGVQAGIGQGQVGSQGVTSMTNLGQAQQSDPLFAASALGKIIGGINAPTTTTNQTQLSPLNQIGSIASALGGSISGTDKLLQQLFPAVGKPGEPGYQAAGGLGSFLKSIGIGGGSTPTTPAGGGSGGGGGYTPGSGGAGLTPNPDGTFTNENGDIVDGNGKVITPGSGPDYNAGSDTNNQPIPDYNGPAIDNNPTNNAGPADLTDAGYGGGI
jgi:hypothetical protein